MRNVLHYCGIVARYLFLFFTAGFTIFAFFSLFAFDRTDGGEILGYRFYSVATNSMSPEFEAGDVVMIRSVDVQELGVGDIISYYSPDPARAGDIITHQIDCLSQNGDNILYTTKGAGNAACDLYPVSQEAVIGRYSARLPKAGSLLLFLKTPPGYMLLILIPFLLILGMQTWRFLHLLKQYRQRQMNELTRQQAALNRSKEEVDCSLQYNRYLTARLEQLLQDVEQIERRDSYHSEI